MEDPLFIVPARMMLFTVTICTITFKQTIRYNVLECSLKVQGLREMCEGLNGVNR